MNTLLIVLLVIFVLFPILFWLFILRGVTDIVKLIPATDDSLD